jgi:hypothetical protein
VTTGTKRVLDRLARAGFEVREGGVAPFGEELPLVTGVAWDRKTAQVAFVAHAATAGQADADAWRQLLFAASGLRHHLAGSGPTAYGTPLVVAIVDSSGERVLRALVEDLATRYAVFSRVDLNLVREAHLNDDDKLVTALAPLLPCCRGMRDATISREDVHRFWQALRDNVRDAARELDAVFGDSRTVAAAELADALIGANDAADERPSPGPVEWLEVDNFRSFEASRLDFGQVTVLHGTNGSGKSSVLEALELLWAGASQRRPAGVPADEYAEHLPRAGSGGFTVRGRLAAESEDRTVTGVNDAPEAELARSVLTQESVSALVNSPPGDRYATLLAVTGLEVPELEPRTRRLLDDAKARADATLRAAGLPPLPRANVRGLEHVRDALAGGFATKLPASEDLSAAGRALTDAAQGTLPLKEWPLADSVVEAVVHADAELERLAEELTERSSVTTALDRAALALREAADERRAAAQRLRRLSDALLVTASEDRTPAQQKEQGPVPPALAARWVAHGQSVQASAARFRADATDLQDSAWSERLVAYADALDAAAAAVPQDELESIARASPPTPAQRQLEVPTAEAFVTAGFTAPPARPDRIAPLLVELHEQLARHASALTTLAVDVEAHPSHRIDGQLDDVLSAICRFELARYLRRRGPIASASEDLLRELLSGRLYPVVRELVAAMVRFEWYFQPLQITAEGREVLLGGLATPSVGS